MEAQPMEAQQFAHPNGTVIMTDAPAVENVGAVTVGGAEPEPEQPAMDDDLTNRSVWVGGIPSNIVQGSSDAVLDINANKHVKSLMSTFGPVVSSTVRVKPGVNKSWALVTFEDQASADAAISQGLEIMDADFEELTLKVERVNLGEHLERSKATQGYLSLLTKTHTTGLDPTPVDTVWVGGLPGSLLGEAPDAAVQELCGRFGDVVTVTVRTKPGENKSWALVTYADPASAELAVQAGMCVPVEGAAEPVELRVEVADVEAELQKGSTGYLAHMASRHEEEVENARKLLRGWWDRAGLTDAFSGGKERRFSIERRLAKFKPLSLEKTSIEAEPPVVEMAA